MFTRLWITGALPLVALALLACPSGKPREREIYTNPLNSLDDVLSRTSVTLDPASSHDGQGAIRIDASEPMTVRLAEFEPEALEDARLIYRAHLKTQDLSGETYLEMWCVLEGMGEFFSRAKHAPLSGTTEWVSQETPFMLEKGHLVKTVKLNLVLTGPGTVWVDGLTLAVADR